MNTAFKLMIMGCSAAVLVACGSSDDAPLVPKVVSVDTTLAANASTVPGLVKTPFSFPAGVPALGTSGPTTVTFTSASSLPTFEISSFGRGTATGTTTFGSCIFTVVTSTFPADSPLATGKTVRIDPCTFIVKSKGLKADGQKQKRGVDLQLGPNQSDDAQADVSVDQDGNLKVNDVDEGKTQTTDVTGGTS